LALSDITNYYDLFLRANGVEKEMMLACGEGRRKRCRPRKRWIEEIHTMSELRDVVEDRARLMEKSDHDSR